LTSRYLLDTNICIHLRQRHPAVVARFRQTEPDECALSVVSLGEMEKGVYRSRSPSRSAHALAELVSLMPVLSLSMEAGRHYGRIAALLETSGRIIGNNDLWIAAHALAEGLIVVTNNEREFARVPDLAVENWTR
jgi:tRNA(fMet)-specific endonuclease VapC